MILEVYTAPVLDPITVAEAKLFCRVDNSDEEALLDHLIEVAREKCEVASGRTLLTTTWDLKLADFPVEDNIVLPRPPIASVTSVSYYDLSNTLCTLTVTTDYLTYLGKKQGYVYLPDGGSWPATYDRPDAVIVRYVAGWTAAASIPACLKQWIRLAVSTLYDNRNQTITGTIVAELPHDFAAGVMDPERLITVI